MNRTSLGRWSSASNHAESTKHLGCYTRYSSWKRVRVLQDPRAAYIDISGSRADIEAAIHEVMSDEINLKPDRFFIHPEEFALAVTHESIHLPDDMVGWLDGRSSLARLGLMVHVTDTGLIR